ncbi:MAG: DUF4345 family protein [Deltaproteobacteria bacterium]|nr:DUF4345 family protein [Deltaproteobacteria bacterium]MBW2361288.1 DUF4345 family protein [Deltaproteobacteria bacterium]
MSAQRIVIRIGSALLLLAGLACALAPGFFAAAAGISASAAGLTELRAVYAGPQLALAGFLLWCDRDPARYAAGLVALLLFCAAVAIIRGAGLLVDAEFATYQLQSLAVEVLAAFAVGWVLLRGRPRASQTA